MNKKLYKLSEGKMLDGVCGGIAEYANLDPTVVRVLWALLTVLSAGLGIVGYIACAIIMPRKDSYIDV